MSAQSQLRRQVTTEIKRRQYVFYTITFSFLFYLVWVLVFGDSGLIRYRQLSGNMELLEQEVTEMQNDNARLSAFLDDYKKGDFLTEKHARENFGLAKPDEFIFIYENDRPNP